MRLNAFSTNDYYWASHISKHASISDPDIRIIRADKHKVLLYLAEHGIISKPQELLRKNSVTENQKDGWVIGYEFEVDRLKFDHNYDQVTTISEPKLKAWLDEFQPNHTGSDISFTENFLSPEAKLQKAANEPFIEYDDEHGTVKYGVKEVVNAIDPIIIEGCLLYRVCRADGARITSEDIIVDYEKKNPGKEILQRSVINAKDRLNDKLRAGIDIGDAVKYQRNGFWLNHAYCSPSSPYKNGN
jgi:hypothetical protein